MKTRHTAQGHLKKLSSSRISSKKGLFSHLPNQTSFLFGPAKNTVVTYSKSRPIQVVKKNHFLTPDTPQVLTPDELQTAEGKGETISKKSNQESQGGSYTSGTTFQSLEASSLKKTNSRGTPLNFTKPLGNNNVKPIRQGSSLALRNISNIPIDKTLSRTQCTTNRNDVQRTYQDKDLRPLRKPIKTPISWKRRKELIKKTKEFKKMNEDMNEVEHQHKEKEKQDKTFKSSSTDDKTCSTHSNVTNYSAKSMSSCTSTSSRGTSKQGHSSTLTVRSMSLCSTLPNDPNIEPKLVALESVDDQALLPKNSTFNESGEQVMVQEFFSNHLSPIEGKPACRVDVRSSYFLAINQDASSIKRGKIPSMTEEELQKKDTTSPHSDEFQNNLIQNVEAQLKNSCVSHQNTDSSNTDNSGPKTSTPTDQAKLPAMLEVDVSPILETSDGNNEKLKKPIDCQLETSVKMSVRKASQRNSLTKCSRDKSATTLDHESKPQNHKVAKTFESQVQDLKENSKTSLPLQASICIEDESDPEQIQDNITPEIMETNKSCPSSSKRKLDYSSAISRPDVNVCFLLDFKCTRKRPCKLWMRTESPCIFKGEQKEMCIPQDVLAII